MIEVHIQNVLDGDADAFRYIIEEYKDRAYSLAVSVVKDEFTAKEVLQIAFVKAFSNLETFRGKSTFSTWFYRIVINEAFTALRKTKREPVAFSELEIDPDQESSSLAGDYLSKMDEDHQRYYINDALDRLSPKESLALRLFYLEEYNIREITGITGWTVSNTKVILHRARNNMKHLFKQLFNIEKEGLL